MAFGPHLLVAGYNANYDALVELDLIYTLLDTLPEKIGMTKITPAQVFRYSGKVPEDWGITGMVIIAESHISIHTFPEKGFFAFDLFSCRDFDTDEVLQILLDTFNLKLDDLEFEVVERGHKFSR